MRKDFDSSAKKGEGYAREISFEFERTVDSKVRERICGQSK